MASGGKSSSKQSSVSSSEGFGASQSYVNPEQAGYLAQLYGAGSGVAGQQMGTIGADASSIGGSLFDQASNFLRTLGGTGAATGQAAAGLTGFRPDFTAGGAAASGVVDQLGADIARQLERQTTGAGGIDSTAALAGNLGGGRNQVERGIAQEGALETFGREAGNLRLQAGQSAEAMRLQALGQGGQLTAAGEQLGAGAAGAGLSQLPDVFNLGLAPYAAQFGPLQALSSLLGSPTVLNSAAERSSSSTVSKGKSKGFEFGIQAPK